MNFLKKIEDVKTSLFYVECNSLNSLDKDVLAFLMTEISKTFPSALRCLKNNLYQPIGLQIFVGKESFPYFTGRLPLQV